MESNYQETLGATKGQATLLVLFIPSVDRYSTAIDQDRWVNQALETLGACFGGATAFPKAQGVWRDDSRGGTLVFDEPVIINCYTSEEALEEHVETLRTDPIALVANAISEYRWIVIDRDYLEIEFPPE